MAKKAPPSAAELAADGERWAKEVLERVREAERDGEDYDGKIKWAVAQIARCAAGIIAALDRLAKRSGE